MLSQLATDCGLTISQPSLRGLFAILSEVDNSTNTGYVFVVRTSNDITKKPSYLSEARWMSLDEAYKTLSLPLISAMIK